MCQVLDYAFICFLPILQSLTCPAGWNCSHLKKEKRERAGVQKLAVWSRDTCLCSFVFLIILAVIGKCFPWEWGGAYGREGNIWSPEMWNSSGSKCKKIKKTAELT